MAGILPKVGGMGYNLNMEKKEIENISEFFPGEGSNAILSPEEKWSKIFSGWLDKIDQEKMMLNLFELKLWLEGMDEFHSSSYLEGLAFKHRPGVERNFDFFVFTFYQVISRITTLLKELDFKKDKFLLNFEEYIVDKLLEDGIGKTFPYAKELFTPESWFASFRLFLQNLRTLTLELMKNDVITQRAYSSLRKLYYQELINNPIIVTLQKQQFIPQMDRVFQPDISQIIASTKDKNLRKALGIFFVIAFRILKINNFIELNLAKNKYMDVTIPLIVVLNKNLENLMVFDDTILLKALTAAGFAEKQSAEVAEVFANLRQERKKIYDVELPLYFAQETSKVKKRKLVQNIVIISEFAIQEIIECVARLFLPEISGTSIFENFISRRQRSIEVKKKVLRLHARIDDYFSHPGTITPTDVFFEIGLFIETDLNYLLYKDWNEFLNYYDALNRTNFSKDFAPTLKAFHAFLSRVDKDLAGDRKA